MTKRQKFEVTWRQGRLSNEQKQIHRRDAARRVSCVHYAKSLSPDAIHFFFQRKAIQCRQREREKKPDPPFKKKNRLAEGAFDTGGVSLHSRGIGTSPVCGHRMSRPHRAGFPGGVVANREHEVHLGSAGPRKFFPAFTAQAERGYASPLQLLQSFGTNRSRGMTSSAIGREGRLSLVIQDRLPHDRTRRIPRAQEQNIVVTFHVQSPVLTESSGSYQGAASAMSKGRRSDVPLRAGLRFLRRQQPTRQERRRRRTG